MILPIYAYGQPVLKKKAKEIDQNLELLPELIENMWETMYNANGVGLAAPQIGQSIRLFMVDTKQLENEEKDLVGIKEVMINPIIIEEKGEEVSYEEGCLSIPDIRADILRKPEITVNFMDQNFEEKSLTLDGISARVVQHENDHLDGKLFTEKVQPLRKRLIKRKLESIKKGNVSIDYRMRFYLK